MTIDDKLSLIELLKAVRPYIVTVMHNAEVAIDNDDEVDCFYQESVIIETEQILHRIDKSIDVLRRIDESK